MLIPPPDDVVFFDSSNSEPFEDTSDAPVESITLYSTRGSVLKLNLSKSTEFNPKRDAIMLYATLSTTLPAETWQIFSQQIYGNSPYLQQVAAGLAQSLSNIPSPKKKPQTRRRSRPIKPSRPESENND